MPGKQTPERTRKLAAPFVFEPLNRVGDRSAILEDGPGVGARFGQRCTRSTERAPEKRPVARGTPRGRYQLDERFCPLSHVPVSVAYTEPLSSKGDVREKKGALECGRELFGTLGD